MAVKQARQHSIDLLTVSMFFGLILIGLFMVYSVSSPEGGIPMSQLMDSQAGKQIIWFGISSLLFFTIMLIDHRVWDTFSYVVYGISLVLLVLVLIVGKEINGAKAWFSFGSFSFQPAEIAKFGTALVMASFLGRFNTDLRKVSSQLLALAILLPPMLLIALQPDAGSALVFMSFAIVLFRAGMNPVYYVLGGLVFALFIAGLLAPIHWILLVLAVLDYLVLVSQYPKEKRIWLLAGLVVLGSIVALFVYEKYMIGSVLGSLGVLGSTFYWFYRKRDGLPVGLSVIYILGGGFAYAAGYAFNNILQPHQQNRINDWLRPSLSDPRGTLYNVVQSRMAISSGGFTGKGYLQGTMTKLNYVPEQTTDFIFCTVGEEQGFLGSFMVITLYAMLIYRITVLAERQRHDFSKYCSYENDIISIETATIQNFNGYDLVLQDFLISWSSSKVVAFSKIDTKMKNFT